MSVGRDKYQSSYESLNINMEVRCDAVKLLSSKLNKICFVDQSIDDDVSELLDMMKSDVKNITPATNYIALGKEIQKMIKRCSEFPVICEQSKNEREERLSRVRLSIEEEKKRLDLVYRQQAQEMKHICQNKLDALEMSYHAYHVFNNKQSHITIGNEEIVLTHYEDDEVPFVYCQRVQH